MRNLSELNINEGGKPVGRLPPSREIINAFQAHFGVILPENYLRLLQNSNGGHPELDSILPQGSPQSARWAVNRFYHLDNEKTAPGNLWKATEEWRHILGKEVIPIASDGGGNQFFLNLKTSPATVKICIHDEHFAILDVAPSFEAFIDGLSVDPDMI